MRGDVVFQAVFLTSLFGFFFLSFYSGLAPVAHVIGEILQVEEVNEPLFLNLPVFQLCKIDALRAAFLALGVGSCHEILVVGLRKRCRKQVLVDVGGEVGNAQLRAVEVYARQVKFAFALYNGVDDVVENGVLQYKHLAISHSRYVYVGKAAFSCVEIYNAYALQTFLRGAENQLAIVYNKVAHAGFACVFAVGNFRLVVFRVEGIHRESPTSGAQNGVVDIVVEGATVKIQVVVYQR